MYIGMIPTMVGGRCQNRCLVFAILAMNGVWKMEFLLLLSEYGLFPCLFLSYILYLNMAEELTHGVRTLL